MKNLIFTSMILGIGTSVLGSSEHSNRKMTYGDDLIPLFEQNCIKCHGGPDPRRKGRIMKKGGLDLTKIDSIKEVIESGQPKDSLLYSLTVTDDEDEIMPPKGRHLSTSEAQLIYKWIEQGADFANFVYVPKEQSRYAILIDKAKPAPVNLIERINSFGAIITPVSEQGPLLRVNLRKATITDELYTSLIELAPFISDLDLSSAQLNSKQLSFLVEAKNLTDLNLSQANINKLGLEQISALPNLEKLNLYSTDIAGTEIFKSFPTLKSLNLCQTKITETQVKSLAQDQVKLKINYMKLPQLKALQPTVSPVDKTTTKTLENKVIQADWVLLRKDDFGTTESKPLITSSFKNYTCPKHLVKDPQVKESDLLMIYDPKSLIIQYNEIDKSKDHKLTLKLVSPGSDRELTFLLNGHILAQNFKLPKNQLISKDFYIKNEHIKDKPITLEIQKNSGPNAVLSYSELFQAQTAK